MEKIVWFPIYKWMKIQWALFIEDYRNGTDFRIIITNINQGFINDDTSSGLCMDCWISYFQLASPTVFGNYYYYYSFLDQGKLRLKEQITTPNWMGFPGSAVAKNRPANVGDHETWVQALGREDPLEKEMATHSVFLLG